MKTCFSCEKNFGVRRQSTFALQNFLFLLSYFLFPLLLHADGPGRIYTTPKSDDTGVLTGKISGVKLTHALAVERDRVRVYRATLAENDTAFRFSQLPVGRYDLVLFTANGRIVEGLYLGETKSDFPTDSQRHLEERVKVAEKFFNRHKILRLGFDDDKALILVERQRDQTVLRQSGENLGAYLRRFEIIELQQAEDDWQMINTRHLYREEMPVAKNPPFFRHTYLPALNSLRLTGAVRDLGTITLEETKNASL